MSRMKTEHFTAIYDFLQNKRADETTLADVLELAEISARSMQRFYEDMDSAVYRELREIAGYIESLKREIGALKANEIRTSRIPAAGQELSAICKATEAATNTIMECAEAVMAADSRTRGLQSPGRRADDDHLRGVLVPGHHRPAHLQGRGDVAAHR